MDDDKPGGVSFLDFIEANYHLQKSKLQKMCAKFNSLIFDEDIFHDTILKVSEAFKESIHSFETYERYLRDSFKTNLIREKMYHRNLMTTKTPDFNGLESSTNSHVDSSVDLDILIEEIDKEFGKTLTMFYLDWLSGYDIKEASEKHNLNSGYYHIRKISRYLREHYNK